MVIKSIIMKRYVAILRGINVSGQKLIKMDALKQHMQDLGFTNVSTYIQSGNIMFESEDGSAPNLADQISHKIYKEFGFQVPVIVKSAGELTAILRNNPFVNSRHEDIDILHVIFLLEQPKQDLLSKIEPLAYKPDEYEVVGDTVYLCCPNGYGRTKLNNNFFENRLKLEATARNWKTVVKLAEMIH